MEGQVLNETTSIQSIELTIGVDGIIHFPLEFLIRVGLRPHSKVTCISQGSQLVLFPSVSPFLSQTSHFTNNKPSISLSTISPNHHPNHRLNHENINLNSTRAFNLMIDSSNSTSLADNFNEGPNLTNLANLANLDHLTRNLVDEHLQYSLHDTIQENLNSTLPISHNQSSNLNSLNNSSLDNQTHPIIPSNSLIYSPNKPLTLPILQDNTIASPIVNHKIKEGKVKKKKAKDKNHPKRNSSAYSFFTKEVFKEVIFFMSLFIYFCHKNLTNNDNEAQFRKSNFTIP